jgi:hypothetical protein
MIFPEQFCISVPNFITLRLILFSQWSEIAESNEIVPILADFKKLLPDTKLKFLKKLDVLRKLTFRGTLQKKIMAEECKFVCVCRPGTRNFAFWSLTKNPS